MESLEKEKSTADLNKQIAEIQREEYNENGSDRQEKNMQTCVNDIGSYRRGGSEIKRIRKCNISVQINSKITEINGQLDEINSDLEKYKLSKEYQQITSPVDGYVNSIAVNTVGRAGELVEEELVTMVPENAEPEWFVT